MSLRSLSAAATLAASIVFHAPHAEARELKVCADPNNLPYSKADRTGFENRIAQVLADELDAKLTYTWFAQRRGFLRNTLNAGTCDVVMGYPPNYQLLKSTRPLYRSSYVFVRRAGEPEVTTFDDPALRHLKIGVQLVGDDGINTPPVQILAKRGIIANLRGYSVYGDYGTAAPLAPIMTAVANGEVDVAVVWGPTAGYFAKHMTIPLRLTPVIIDPTMLAQQLTYDIAIGVRKDEAAFADEIDAAIRKRREEIDQILEDYGVPRLDRQRVAGSTP